MPLLLLNYDIFMTADMIIIHRTSIQFVSVSVVSICAAGLSWNNIQLISDSLVSTSITISSVHTLINYYYTYTNIQNSCQFFVYTISGLALFVDICGQKRISFDGTRYMNWPSIRQNLWAPTFVFLHEFNWNSYSTHTVLGG